MSSPISGFTAIPNPQMLAFMPIQSYLMMYFAGAGWQIGKRKISAIPNPEFNKMSANDLLKGFTADLRETIPTLERSLNDITPLIRVLIEQYGDFIKEAIAAMPQALQNIIGGGGEFQNIPTSESVSGGGAPPFGTAAFLHYLKKLADASQAQEEISVSNNPNLDPSKFNAPSVRSRETPIFYLGRYMSESEWNSIKEQERSVQLARSRASGTGDPIPQVRQGLTKKAAGQSQIMERLKLIRQIKVAADTIKRISIRFPFKTSDKHALAENKKQLVRFQQLLVNLLTRYRF